MCHITLNKVAIFDDNGIITPGGVRIGKYMSHCMVSEILYGNNTTEILKNIICIFFQKLRFRILLNM